MKYRIGCLIIHGFGGTTSDVEPLVNIAVKRVYYFCPSLNQCKTEEHFSSTNYKDWINLQRQFILSKSKCKNSCNRFLYGWAYCTGFCYKI